MDGGKQVLELVTCHTQKSVVKVPSESQAARHSPPLARSFNHDDLLPKTKYACVVPSSSLPPFQPGSRCLRGPCERPLFKVFLKLPVSPNLDEVSRMPNLAKQNQPNHGVNNLIVISTPVVPSLRIFPASTFHPEKNPPPGSAESAGPTLRTAQTAQSSGSTRL